MKIDDEMKKIKKNLRMMKVDSETHAEMKRIARELSVIEGRDVHMCEIPKRLLTSDEIKERLKLGSKERRMGLR